MRLTCTYAGWPVQPSCSSRMVSRKTRRSLLPPPLLRLGSVSGAAADCAPPAESYLHATHALASAATYIPLNVSFLRSAGTRVQQGQLGRGADGKKACLLRVAKQ